MKASIVDLRYKMREVLKALNRCEDVKILYHGKLKGVITPLENKQKKRVKDHPLFGMNKGSLNDVEKTMAELRKARN